MQTQLMLNELQMEAGTTRRLLERVPGDKLAWQPHPTAMSLGQLALHVAQIPAAICGLAQLDGFDVSQANFNAPQPQSTDEILAAFDQGVPAAMTYLQSLTPEAAAAPWKMSAHGNEVFTLPRAALLRALLLNHLYHHRGQLSVYLRMLEVPIPVIYGRSRDENPFG